MSREVHTTKTFQRELLAESLYSFILSVVLVSFTSWVCWPFLQLDAHKSGQPVCNCAARGSMLTVFVGSTLNYDVANTKFTHRLPRLVAHSMMFVRHCHCLTMHHQPARPPLLPARNLLQSLIASLSLRQSPFRIIPWRSKYLNRSLRISRTASRVQITRITAAILNQVQIIVAND